MSQSDFGDLSSPLSGTALINTYLEPWRTALHSMHSGASRPSYATGGMMWLDTTTTPWVIKVFDGSDDISIGTVNATTNLFTPSGVILNNYAATTAPTTGDDSADGYSVGSTWINNTTDKMYVLVDSTVAAAVWREVTIGASAVPFTPASSSTAAYIDLAEDTDNGSNRARLIAPASLSGDVEITMPSSTGTLATTAETALVLISTQTASASATIDFTGLNSTYNKYIVEISGVIPATDGSALWMRTSSNGGSSYDAGAADYSWGYIALTAGSTVTQNTDSSDDSIELSADQGTDTNESGAFTVEIINPSATNFTKVLYRGTWQNSGGALLMCYGGGGIRSSAADVDAIRFLYASGNIEAGVFKLYGVKA
jgi:hypothetical protein